MNNLRNLGSSFRISLPTDEHGYTGRECPNPECKGYFKIVFGTGLHGVTDCHCPYCGHTSNQETFATPDQIEYAKSVVMRKVTEAFIKDLKSLEFDIKPQGPFGIGFSMKLESGQLHPIHWYREKSMETHIECPQCTLKYAVFGVFAFCPDCGQHNSIHILVRNLELTSKMLDMALTMRPEIASRLIENALEDCVASFDGFGREVCSVHAVKSAIQKQAEKVSFQNLEGAKENVNKLFGFDIANGLSGEEWTLATRCFQKRHVLAHKMGVMDEDYVRKSGDRQAIVGRKVRIDADEVRRLIPVIGRLSNGICAGFQNMEKKA